MSISVEVDQLGNETDDESEYWTDSELSGAMREALDGLRKGKFVLVYDRDGREEETDFVIPSQFVRGGDISRMRRDGGGLICTTVTRETA